MPQKHKKKTPLSALHQAGQSVGAFLLLLNHYFIPIVLILLTAAILYFAHYKYKDLVKDHTRQSDFLPSVFVDESEHQAVPPPALVDLADLPAPIEPAKPAPATPQPGDEWLETTDFAPDMEPFMPPEEDPSLPLIQEEVRQRLQEIEQNVLSRLK